MKHPATTVCDLFAIFVLLCSALSGSAWAATVRVSGAPSFNQNVFQPYKAEIEKEAGVTIGIIAISSVRGIDDLLAKRADLAMLGTRLETAVKEIEAKRPNSNLGGLVEHVIGESQIDFVVNPANPIKALKREQLAAILGGRTESWSVVGGTNHPILVAVEPTDAMYRQIQDAFLTPSSLTWTRKSRVVDSLLQVPALIAQAPDAIGYMNSLASADQKRRVARLSTDVELKRMNVLVTTSEPSADVANVVRAVQSVLARLIVATPSR